MPPPASKSLVAVRLTADLDRVRIGRRWAWTLAIGASSVLLLGASVELATAVGSGRGAVRRSPAVAVAVPAPRLDVIDTQAGRVAWGRPLRLHVTAGTLRAVAVVDESGRWLAGAPVDETSWRSTVALAPNIRYDIHVDMLDGHRRLVTEARSVQAADAPRHLTATVSPGDGDVVGIGMPVVVRFNADVPKSARAGVVDRLAVAVDPPVDGAWRWIGNHEVHWRPASYWAPGTRVKVHSDLTGLDLGGGMWGTEQHNVSFVIGDSHVSTANVGAHTFTVTSGGKTLRVLAMSAGRDKFPTKAGVHIALEKSAVVTMDSQTVGIPRTSPDGYFERVMWDVRISNTGEFVHAAPWSVKDQGHRNVSHGCVNLSTADAQWFFNFTRRGDIVNVVDSPAPPVLSDAGMADWNLTWDAWRAA